MCQDSFILSLLRGTARFTFCLRKLQMHVAFVRHDSSDQITEIMTRLSQLGRARGGGGLQTHIYIPRAELSKLAFDKREEGAAHQTEGSQSGTPFSFAGVHW